MKIYKAATAILFFIFLTNCNSKKSENKENTISEAEKKQIVDIKLIRLEQELWQNKTKEGIELLLKKYPQFNKKYMGKIFPDDKITVKEVFFGINNPAVDTLYQISQTVFGDMQDIKNQYARAATEIKANYPQFYVQDMYSFISGMGFWGQDFLISDSIIVISLDYFLAEKCKYKPQLPVYILDRYRKEYVVPTIVATIANYYNKTDITDNSLIAEMIYYGKIYYFQEKILPEIADSLIAGYSSVQLKDVEKHSEIIWTHFIDKKLLFETKNEITVKYVGERPAVTEIGNNCPGRIGRWVGWQIVRKYMNEHPEISLKQLMDEKDARKIFIASKYRPS